MLHSGLRAIKPFDEGRRHMDIFGTISALFSGDRVSHTDTFILAAVALGLYIGLRTLRKRLKKDD